MRSKRIHKFKYKVINNYINKNVNNMPHYKDNSIEPKTIIKKLSNKHKNKYPSNRNYISPTNNP